MELDLTPTSKSTDDSEIDTPTPPHRTHPINLLSFKNQHSPPPTAAVLVSYKECLKNHAANIGGNAVDGCGEFMPSSASNETEPTSLKCAACGCHRNFHRREPESPTAVITPPFLDFRHPPLNERFSLSPSPPPPLSTLSYASTFFSRGILAEEHHRETIGRKRFRTKFSPEQKGKMQSFSEKIGWTLQKCDEKAVKEFCHDIGVSKGVLKVWMHNNKSSSGKKEINGGGNDVNGGLNNFENINGGGRESEEKKMDNNGIHFHIHGSSS